VPLPDVEGRREIFRIHSIRMTLDKTVDIEELVKRMDKFSGAEIRAVCTEAGYFAIRDNRTKVVHKDFEDAVTKVLEEKQIEGTDYMKMFG
ncbi:MAG: hypothetical protein AABY13_01115, partial [Nanoarchaeota archaeon]